LIPFYNYAVQFNKCSVWNNVWKSTQSSSKNSRAFCISKSKLVLRPKKTKKKTQFKIEFFVLYVCGCQPISSVLFQPIHTYCKSTFLLLPVLIIWHIWHNNFVRRRHNRTIICKLIIISQSVVFIVLAKLNRITIKDKIKIYQSDIPASTISYCLNFVFYKKIHFQNYTSKFVHIDVMAGYKSSV
jgi:hypothetical protein